MVAGGVVAYGLLLAPPFILMGETMAYLRRIPWTRLVTDDRWTPLFNEPQLGILALLLSTSLVVGVALAVGGGAAWLVAWVDSFAGAGSGGLGRRLVRYYEWLPPLLWGWLFLVWGVSLLQRFLGWWSVEAGRYSGLAAGLALALVVFFPVYSRAQAAFEEAGRVFPAVRSLGLEGRRLYLGLWLRGAFPGLVSALAAGAAVAYGESIVVTLLGGQAVRESWNLLDPVQTVGAFLVQTALGDVSPGSPGRGPLALAALVLWLVAGGCGAVAAGTGSKIGRRAPDMGAARQGKVPVGVTGKTAARAARFLGASSGVPLVLAAAALLWEGSVFLAGRSAAPDVRSLLAYQWWPLVAGTLGGVGAALAAAGVLGGGAAFVVDNARRTRLGRILEIPLRMGEATPPVVIGIVVLLGLGRLEVPAGTLLGGSLALTLALLPRTVEGFRRAAAGVASPAGRTAVALGLDVAGTWPLLVAPAVRRRFLGCLLSAAARVLGDPAPLLVLGVYVVTTFAPSAPGDPFVTLPTHAFFWLTRSEPGFPGAVAVVLWTLVIAAAGLRWAARRLEEE
ncbi:MAG: hypothetical protein Kow00109_18010 [Acidobacteriota bacterium]